MPLAKRNKIARKSSNIAIRSLDAERLLRKNAQLEQAIRTVLRYISSHQVYDKDARRILSQALEEPVQ